LLVPVCPDISRSSRLLRAIVNLAAFIVGLAGVWLAAAPLFPPPHLPVLSEKRAHFLTHAGEFDAVFIGSSRVYRGFVPAVFDETLRARRGATRSFNFAMDGVWPPESFFRVREFLRERGSVRWVFIELLPVNARIPPENADTPRSIYWHDWHYTVLAWRETFARAGVAWPQRLKWAGLHAELFVRRLSQFSSGSRLLDERLRPEVQKALRKEHAQHPLSLSQHGFLPEPATPMTPATAAQFLRELAAYQQNLAPVPIPPHLRAELRSLVAAVRDGGATPVFVITPATGRPENFADLRGQGIDADLISFKDPRRHPQFYDPAMRFDGPHLNERGAREFSRLLAEEFAGLLDARR
jgi:hypothetical protein